MRLAAIFALLLASPAFSATITELPDASDRSDNFEELLNVVGQAIETNVGTFRGESPYGMRVQNIYDEWDRAQTAMVDTRWETDWSWTLPEGVPGMRFTLIDAFDRPNTTSQTMTAGGETYSFTRAASGNMRHFQVLFDAEEEAVLRFARTGTGLACAPGSDSCDGIGVTAVAPVPLPAAGWLLIGALGLTGAIRRLRLSGKAA